MSPARLSAALPALVVLLLARPWLAPGSGLERPAPSLAEETRAAACGVHGCGCPHVEVEPSCCCAPEAEREATAVEHRASLARRTRSDSSRRKSAELVAAPRSGPPGPVVTGFHCSRRGKGGAAPRERSATALELALLELALDPAPRWAESPGARLSSGPRRAPEPPPPRPRAI